MSYFDRANASSKPAARRAPKARDWVTQPLSKSQKTTLSILARKAWSIQREAGLTDCAFDAWRHEQVFIACGRAGLTDANNKHYRSILGHFQRLAGDEEGAQKTWAKTGRVAGSTEVHDTHENRELARALLRDLVAGSGGLITEQYCEEVCRPKSGGRGLYEATAKELQDTVMTVTARLREKRNAEPFS